MLALAPPRDEPAPSGGHEDRRKRLGGPLGLRLVGEAEEGLLDVGEGVGAEQLVFVAHVRKTNQVGKVQARLLVLSDHAVYNCDLEAKKVKRRIPLAALALDILETAPRHHRDGPADPHAGALAECALRPAHRADRGAARTQHHTIKSHANNFERLYRK